MVQNVTSWAFSQEACDVVSGLPAVRSLPGATPPS
jgi:hypothetical protein